MAAAIHHDSGVRRMVNVAKEQITSLFVGEQRIKTVMAGTVPVYDRPGGYIYLTLDTETNDQPSKIQNEKE